jgi:glutathione S-transferase
MLTRLVNVATSLATTLVRGAAGMSVGRLGPRPQQRLALYEFEGCPFCRKVREALSILDLESDIYPCPKNGPRFRPEVVRRGGRAMFPYLVDPNTGLEMYESDEIVRYLFERYGDGRVPTTLSMGPITDATSVIAGLARPGSGAYYSNAKQPSEPLELYSFEASPFCRIVRERLCTLELPYILHNVAKGSPSRKAFVERSGKMQVPYLVDPNTGTEMFESDDIVAYLDREYAAS